MRRAGLRASAAPTATAQLTRWDALTALLAGILLQYVWRIQSVFPQLAFVQFTTLVSVGAIVLFLTDGRSTRRLAHAGHKLFLPIIVIFALAVLSIPTSLHDGASVQFLTSNFIKTGVLAVVLTSSIRDRRDVERLVRVLVWGAVGYVVMALATRAGGRLGGTAAYDPNDLGLFTVSTVPLCVYFLRRGAPKKDRLLGLVSSILLLMATVQTSSRGGFLALVAVVAYGVFGMGAAGAVKRLVIVCVAAGLVSLVATDEYWQRIATIIKPQEDYNWAGNAQSGRIEVWKRGLGYMAQRPLLGVGLNAFEVAEGTLSGVAASNAQQGRGFKWSTAHNSYVQIGAELGVFGLLTFIALLGGSFLAARRVSRTAPNPDDRVLAQSFSGMIVGFATGSVFLSHAYSTFLYFSIALFVGFVRVVARDARLAQHPAPLTSIPVATLRSQRGGAVSGRVGGAVGGAMRGGLGTR